MQRYGKLFAKVYNERWSAFPEKIAGAIYNFCHDKLDFSGEKKLLDLFCGTGQLANFFLNRNFVVTGVDLSEDMLHFASDKNHEFIVQGKASFLCENAINFVADKEFNLVTATYNAVNHLNSEEELKILFKNVYFSLRKNGYFIFDLNTKKGLKNWNGLEVINNDETTLIRNGIFFDELNQAYMHIFGFVLMENNLFEKFDEKMFNLAYNMSNVKSELLKAGFSDVIFTEIFDCASVILEPEKANRVLVIAEK